MEGVDFAGLISNGVATVGFPVCMAIACGYYIKQIIDRLMNESEKRESLLLDGNSKTADALNSLSDTMHDISQSLETLSDTNSELVNNINTSLLDIKGSLSIVQEQIQHKL